MATHSPEHLAHEERRYLQIFLLLGILTVLEIGVIYLPIPHLAIVAGLVVMAGTKAALVALYYMHLSDEKPTLTWIALTPAILCVFLLFMLAPDLGAITRILTHAPGGGANGTLTTRPGSSPVRALVAAIGAVLLGCAGEPLPRLGIVPAFRVVERAGSALTETDLRGKVWVANFIFTRCPDVCPVLTARMRDLQRTLDAAGGNVTLVSVSVDPGHDTPEVLQTYATAHQAGPGWHFVTGPRDGIAALLRDGFHVAFADDGPSVGPITHSDRFVLVDRDLAIRGYYHGADPDDLRRLAEDARRLAAD